MLALSDSNALLIAILGSALPDIYSPGFWNVWIVWKDIITISPQATITRAINRAIMLYFITELRSDFGTTFYFLIY